LIINLATAREADDAIVTLRPRALRVMDAAKYIGVGRTKMFELIKAGRVDAKRDGAIVLVTVASLDSYLDALPNARETKEQ
jgi:excisionase family DNA binding protein